jgi:hypothetical protein
LISLHSEKKRISNGKNLFDKEKNPMLSNMAKKGTHAPPAKKITLPPMTFGGCHYDDE